MKIAYLSPTFMSDVDLSYLSALRQECSQIQCDYYLMLAPRQLRGAAVNIQSQYPKNGVFPARVYEELKALDCIFPVDQMYVVNSTCTRLYHPASYSCYYQLYRKLKSYDLIHYTWPLPIPAFILYLLRHKLVMTVHDPFPHSSVRGWAIKAARYMAFKGTSNFVILNKAQRQDFIKAWKLKEDDVFDSRLSAYTYLRGYLHSAPQEQGYILFFGQVTPHKGIRYLFEAMKSLHQRFPHLKLVVAGRWKKGYTEPELTNPPSYIDFQSRFIPDDELAMLIQNARFVVTPYLDATQSGVIMSAFAFGKPCIATNVGGLPEMVIHEKYGLIIPPQDTEAIVDSATRLLNDPSLCQKLSDNILQDYLQGNKSWKKIVHEMANYYKRINDKNHGTA